MKLMGRMRPNMENINMADNNALVDQLSELTVLEAAELSKALEEKWGVSAAAAVAVAGPAAAAAAPTAEEQPEFDVIPVNDCDKKPTANKEVRAITALGLHEAQDLVGGEPRTAQSGENNNH